MIDLHVHSRCSDGSLTIEELTAEAKNRNLELMSITDHDSVRCQENAQNSANKNGIKYITGVELNITFLPPDIHGRNAAPLDFLGYQFDIEDKRLRQKIQEVSEHRRNRAMKIMSNINSELRKAGKNELTKNDSERLLNSVEGVLGRPHIADYLVKRRIVKTKQEAFGKYLVKCDVPKYPFYAEQASKLVRNAGGIVILAHPNDPHGTSLIKLTKSLIKQTEIIKESLLDHIDGVECWHSRSDPYTTSHYLEFAKRHNLIMTGGSDCHQRPILMGTVDIPEWIIKQFNV
ncbi:MAG: PHP domain-containing protein [Candidatus Bathyarchaeota archaeon]|nr:MAG: PHP domain-containing protein [Candidatus Bathyarchaeota archaeon]